MENPMFLLPLTNEEVAILNDALITFIECAEAARLNNPISDMVLKQSAEALKKVQNKLKGGINDARN